MKNANPDTVILACYYNDGGLILKQAKEMEIEALFISTESLDDPKLIEIAGEAADGLILSTMKPGAGPAFSGFKQAYKETYGKEPGLLCDFGYDTLNIADRVIVMDDGRVIASGSPKQIRNSPRVLEAYLGE